jgi:hypothetical protein
MENKLTPKEKAKELVGLCKIDLHDSLPQLQSEMFKLCILISAKKCALIAVNEILWHIIKYADNSREYVAENSNYYQEVKQEIENL